MFDDHRKPIIWFLTCCLVLMQIKQAHCAESESEELILDEKLQKLALDLIKSSADQSFLDQLSKKCPFMMNQYPKEPLAIVYINYTRRQIQALENELSLHDHYIYEPIKVKTEEIKQNFSKTCDQYQSDGDLFRLEQEFLTTGEQIVSLQKLILRIINSKLEERMKMPHPSFSNHGLMGKSGILDEFDYLARLFFGFPINDVYQQTSSFVPVNQLFTLLEKLRTATIGGYSVETKSEYDEIDNKSFDNLSTLLYRLRYVYYLYRIASYSNLALNTLYLTPYAYQATIKLVDLLGFTRFTNPLLNPLLNQLRFWMNLLTGNIQLNIFSQSNNIKQAKYDPKLVNELIKTLRENEQRQRQQIEQQRLKMMIENLLKSQNKQQEQIDTVLQLLTNKTQPITTNQGDGSQHGLPPSPSIISIVGSTGINQQWFSTTTQRTTPMLQGETLQQLKKQRKLLNELLQELQKPFNSTNATNAVPVGPPVTGQQNDRIRELNQAQTALMAIMRNITPLINAVGQRNLVSAPTIQKSKLDLLTIVNSINNREFLDSDDDSPLGVMERLASRLKNVLDDIIHEATSYLNQ